MQKYKNIYREWQNNPASFWSSAASKIDWFQPPEAIFDPGQGTYGRWFVGGKCNTAFNCLDRHVNAGRGDWPAVIYDSPLANSKRTISFRELADQVTTFASALAANGIKAGDRVIIYMPMIPEAIVAMLACARLGAIHSVVFGGFAANELAIRMDDADPKAIITASCGLEPNRVVPYKPVVDAAIGMAKSKPQFCVVLERPMLQANLDPEKDFDWHRFVTSAPASNSNCVAIDATDPLYILYTSGSTGRPKGVLRDTAGHMVALQWSMQNIYGVNPGDVFWAASDIGWVVGHSYIIYGPLLNGNATVLYEGKPVGTPDAGAFWRVVSEHRVNVLFTAPTAIRAIRKEDPEGRELAKYDLSHLRALFLAGERADPATIEWIRDLLGVPVIDHWWQTETGWAIAANPFGIEELPTKLGSSGVPMPGYDVRILDEQGAEMPAGEMGSVAIKLPLPPACLPTLWNNDNQFADAYLSEFDGYYKTADAGYRDTDGYLFVMGRTDDIINVAGHRLSTGAIEEVLASHEAVAECAVIGVSDALKGEVPLAFLVLKSGTSQAPVDIERDVIRLVRDQIGPVVSFKKAIIVNRLPKTRSGKILRGTIKKIAEGQAYAPPATIDDPTSLAEFETVLKSPV